MLVSCKKDCKINTTTTGLLDIETNEVICQTCEEVLEEISDYTKNGMKSSGHIVKRKKESYVFKCIKCNKDKKVVLSQDSLVGKGCQDNCNFNLSNYMTKTLKELISLGDPDE